MIPLVSWTALTHSKSVIGGRGIVPKVKGHKVGEFVRRDEPTVRGSTPVQLWATIGQSDLVGLVGVEEVSEFNGLIDLPFKLAGYEPRLAGARDAGGHCGSAP
jgi:hypothetical protein